MTDNLNELNPANAEAPIAAGSSTTWRLNALTAALGDLSLTVSDSLSVGRGSDNDVVLGSKAVSRNHAVLSVSNTELYVKDLGSSNGTFVNDERIEDNKSVLLNAEDKLGFASFEFQVMAPVAETTRVGADNLPAQELEDIVGKVQENLENTKAVTQESPVSESAESTAAPSLSSVATKEPSESSNANIEAVPVDNQTPPVVKETIISEVLSASAGQEAMSAAPVKEDIVPAASADTRPPAATEETLMTNKEQPIDKPATEPVINKPVVKEPITEQPTTEGKLMHDKAAHQEPVVSPEHDKTTTTALQEEADPDILRAKQAATAQFSGTANLGQGRDLGTTGNNAMDQAINNPANNARGEKKPSGGWFIWVFIAILIIAVALWLFNMGGA